MKCATQLLGRAGIADGVFTLYQWEVSGKQPVSYGMIAKQDPETHHVMVYWCRRAISPIMVGRDTIPIMNFMVEASRRKNVIISSGGEVDLGCVRYIDLEHFEYCYTEKAGGYRRRVQVARATEVGLLTSFPDCMPTAKGMAVLTGDYSYISGR